MTEGRRAHAGNSGAAGPGSTSVVPPGVWVDDSDEDDPVLRNADGSLVDTLARGVSLRRAHEP